MGLDSGRLLVAIGYELGTTGLDRFSLGRTTPSFLRNDRHDWSDLWVRTQFVGISAGPRRIAVHNRSPKHDLLPHE